MATSTVSECKSAEETSRTSPVLGGDESGAGRGISPVSDASEGTPTPDLQPPQPTTKLQKKEQMKAKRREDKTLEQVLRALSSLESTEEKLAALCKKYTDLLEEHRQLQQRFKQSQKSLTSVVKEKEHLQSEHSKAVLAKSKLESLCRELQRHNKLIKEESLGRAKEEEEKRKEVTNKFQTTINDIQAQMNDHYQKNTKLREENVELAGKLKSLIEQYETREEHIEKIVNHKDLEKQLVEAKLAQCTLMMSEEKERHLKERELLLKDAMEAHKRIAIMEEGEKALREQVALYTEKYEDFQSTLTKSNSVFTSFKSEMDKMTKKIKKLEKETVMWRGRWENSNKTLLDMAEEKARATKEAGIKESKIKKLESLCRVMQEERRQAAAALTKAQEEAGGDPPNSAANGGTEDSAAATESTAVSGPSAEATEEVSGRPRAKNGTPEKSVHPTSTPPNTPDEGTLSRASPVTVVEPETARQQEATETETGAATQGTAEQAKATKTETETETATRDTPGEVPVAESEPATENTNGQGEETENTSESTSMQEVESNNKVEETGQVPEAEEKDSEPST